MNEKEIKSILKTVGIPLGIVTLFFIVAIVFYMYTKYLEHKKLKLEIIQLSQKNAGIAKCC